MSDGQINLLKEHADLSENLFCRLLKTTPYCYTNLLDDCVLLSRLREWRLKKGEFSDEKISDENPLNFFALVEINSSELEDVFTSLDEHFCLNICKTDHETEILSIHNLFRFLRKSKFEIENISLNSFQTKDSIGEEYLEYFSEKGKSVVITQNLKNYYTRYRHEIIAEKLKEKLKKYDSNDNKIFFVDKDQLSITEKGHYSLNINEENIFIIRKDVLQEKAIATQLEKLGETYKSGFLVETIDNIIKIYSYFECKYFRVLTLRYNHYYPLNINVSGN